jgi:phosphoenolpyruvate-protein kinase (PTS system EI component)
MLLPALAARVETEIDSRLANVFEAHKLIVDDSYLKEELQKEITGNLITASSAVKAVLLRWEKRLGITVHPLEEIPRGCILITSRLLPSDTIFLSDQSVSAVLLEYGSIGSHAALFAREMGLPCISGFPDLLTTAPDNALALVDADTGIVTIHPQKESVLSLLLSQKMMSRFLYSLMWDAGMIQRMACKTVRRELGCTVWNGFTWDALDRPVSMNFSMRCVKHWKRPKTTLSVSGF